MSLIEFDNPNYRAWEAVFLKNATFLIAEVEVVKKSFSILFITAGTRVKMFGEIREKPMFAEKMAMLRKPQLLIIDEVAFLPILMKNANLSFSLVCC